MWWVVGGAVGFAVLVAVAFVLWTVAFPPDRVERHPNGRVQARGPHYHGDRQGRWTFRHEDGWKECEGSYRQGVESGTWTFYHPNGRPCARGELDGWCRRGDWEFWDDSGRPLGESEFLTRYPDAGGGRCPAHAG